MSRSIQLDDVPNAVYTWLHRRAEARGITISELARQMLIEHAPEPGQLEFPEWLEWLGMLEPLGIDVSTSDIVEALHAGRAERF
jgi:hypothetical protein